jgi:hypothetical protein
VIGNTRPMLLKKSLRGVCNPHVNKSTAQIGLQIASEYT